MDWNVNKNKAEEKVDEKKDKETSHEELLNSDRAPDGSHVNTQNDIEETVEETILTFDGRVKLIEEFLMSEKGKIFNLKSIVKGGRLYVYQGAERNTWVRLKQGFIIFYKSSLRRSMLTHIPKLFEGIKEERR